MEKYRLFYIFVLRKIYHLFYFLFFCCFGIFIATNPHQMIIISSWSHKIRILCDIYGIFMYKVFYIVDIFWDLNVKSIRNSNEVRNTFPDHRKSNHIIRILTTGAMTIEVVGIFRTRTIPSRVQSAH
jgi:hypothetical protein